MPLAQTVRAAGVPVGAVGLITEPAQAEELVASGRADVVLLARAALRDPAWPQRAAAELGCPARPGGLPAELPARRLARAPLIPQGFEPRGDQVGH